MTMSSATCAYLFVKVLWRLWFVVWLNYIAEETIGLSVGCAAGGLFVFVGVLLGVFAKYRMTVYCFYCCCCCRCFNESHFKHHEAYNLSYLTCMFSSRASDMCHARGKFHPKDGVYSITSETTGKSPCLAASTLNFSLLPKYRFLLLHPLC